MSTNQTFAPSGASAAAEAVRAHVTALPIPTTSNVPAQRQSAAERDRPMTGERP